MMTDPIADMLTRIRNAVRVERDFVDVPYSRIKQGIAEVLKSEGYIWGYTVVDSKPCNTLRIQLKYGNNGEKVIRHIKRLSKPGRRVYCSGNELRPVLNGMGITILSTSHGVLSDRAAKAINVDGNARPVGGELICEVW